MKSFIEKWSASAGLITLALLGTYAHSGFMDVYSFLMWFIFGAALLCLCIPSKDLFKDNDFIGLGWVVFAAHIYFMVWNEMPILAACYIFSSVILTAKKKAYFREIEQLNEM